MVYLPFIVRREPAAPWFSDTAALNDGHPWASARPSIEAMPTARRAADDNDARTDPCLA
jgi:hypothetical protein